MLDIVVEHPIVGSFLLEGEAVETVHKLQHGDGLLGWEGDPHMTVRVRFPCDERGRVLNSGRVLFDVFSRDTEGKEITVIRGAEYCDQRLIQRVIDADGRRHDFVAEAIKEYEVVGRRRDSDRRAQFSDLNDRLDHAITKDLGHLEGGTRRNLLHTRRPVKPKKVA